MSRFDLSPRLRWLLGASWLVVPTVSAVAQLTSPVRDLSAIDAPLPRASDAIVHDSTNGYRWMLSGDADFSRYTPGMCVRAVLHTDHVTERWVGWDTISANTPGDTLSSAAQALGRRCARQFSVANVPSSDLPALIELDVTLHNVPSALAALDRTVTEARGVDQKGEAIVAGIRVFLASPLDYVSVVDSLLGRLDALGESQRWRTAIMQDDILSRYGGERNGVYDATQALQLLNRAWSTHKVLTPREQSHVGIGGISAVQSATLLPGLLTDVPLLQLCARARGNMLKWGTSARLLLPGPHDTVTQEQPDPRQLAQRTAPSLYDLAMHDTSALAGVATGAGMAALVYEMCKNVAHTVGHEITSADFSEAIWYPNRDTIPGRAPQFPVPGHVTMIVVADAGTGRMTAAAASVRRLYEKYHVKGLDAVLVTRTHGFAWASPPLANDAWTRIGAWYFHTYLKIPFSVAVLQTSIVTDETGVRTEKPVGPAATSVWPWGIVLLGRDGKTLPPLGVLGTRGSEGEYEAMIRHALGLSSQ